MGRKQRIFMGICLLAAFVGPLSWYFFWLSVGHGETPLVIEEKMLTAHDELFDIHMKPGGKGWVAGKYGLILHTEDGGKSWRVQPTGTTHALTGVSFADDRHGFAVGGGGTILTTTDGGKSWEAQSWEGKDHLLGVHAASPSRAYVVGAFGTFLSTSDGGASWRRHKFSWEKLIPEIVQELGYMEPNLNVVYFASAEMGWVGGEFGLVLYTRDGGQRWVTQRYGEDLPQIVSMVFRGEKGGWAVGQRGTVLKTVDGGRAWRGIPLEVRKDLYGISLNGERGVIVGDEVVLKSGNGGSSWAAEDLLSGDTWFSGVVVDGKEAIAVGSSGTIRLIGLEGDDKGTL